MAQRQSTIIKTIKKEKKGRKTRTKPINPREGEESDLQSFYIIRFKCPVFTTTNKNHREYKEMGKSASFKRKK